MKERLGERLVREGFLERQVLTELEKLELDGVRLDFSSHVPNAQIELVVMNQTLDSIDRLALFPMLDYEIGEQTSVYRGAQISGAAIIRIAWLENVVETFLKWRKHLERTPLPCCRLGAACPQTMLRLNVYFQRVWDLMVCKRRFMSRWRILRVVWSPLEQDGVIQVGAANAPVWLQVPSNLSRTLAGLLGGVLTGCVFFASEHLQLDSPWGKVAERARGITRRVSTRRYVEFEVERYQERFGRYPTSEELKALSMWSRIGALISSI